MNLTLVIRKLRRHADHYERTARETKDKFNKGYFEGKAEKCLIISDALESENTISCLAILNQDH